MATRITTRIKMSKPSRRNDQNHHEDQNEQTVSKGWPPQRPGTVFLHRNGDRDGPGLYFFIEMVTAMAPDLFFDREGDRDGPGPCFFTGMATAMAPDPNFS